MGEASGTVRIDLLGKWLFLSVEGKADAEHVTAEVAKFMSCITIANLVYFFNIEA
ncbi:hypothetical protein ACE38V_19145 [Cytobacillus sp. Hz8]|uniref:hypothetical protein n=1 Tax=Cytobacillus sp. Hz8 TaxID=3347168 RepID=UPI0035E127AA